MGDFFVAKDPVILLLRLGALLVAIALPFLIAWSVRGLASSGFGWFREEARLARTKTGYVAAILGRNSTLLGACTFVFAVLRTDHFASLTAQKVAMALSSIAVIAGLFVGTMVIAITSEIVRQTSADG